MQQNENNNYNFQNGTNTHQILGMANLYICIYIYIYLYIFFYKCLYFMWFFKLLICEKLLPHISQLWALSLLCISRCVLRLMRSVNFISHFGQLYSLNFEIISFHLELNSGQSSRLTKSNLYSSIIAQFMELLSLLIYASLGSFPSIEKNAKTFLAALPFNLLPTAIHPAWTNTYFLKSLS